GLELDRSCRGQRGGLLDRLPADGRQVDITAGLQLVATGEGEEVGHQPPDAIELVHRRLDEAVRSVAPPELLHVAPRGGERVADLVGDARRRLAERGELLCMGALAREREVLERQPGVAREDPEGLHGGHIVEPAAARAALAGAAPSGPGSTRPIASAPAGSVAVAGRTTRPPSPSSTSTTRRRRWPAASARVAPTSGSAAMASRRTRMAPARGKNHR